MKKNLILFLLVSFSLGLFLVSCGGAEEKSDENGNQKKIVEINESNDYTNTLNQAEDIAEDIENKEETNKNVAVFVGTFVDASVLDMSYFYFFKDKNGKELGFYHHPGEGSFTTSIQFMGADLMVNKQLIGKKFRIKYTTIEKIDENTGELAKYNIPISIETE
jgi:hypothetical protein